MRALDLKLLEKLAFVLRRWGVGAMVPYAPDVSALVAFAARELTTKFTDQSRTNSGFISHRGRCRRVLPASSRARRR